MKNIKKIVSVILVLSFAIVFFSGCKEKPKVTQDGKKILTVGLIQLGDHKSLNEIREAFTAKLNELAKNEDFAVEIDYKNAQFEPNNINTISRNFVDQKVDVIVAIATPAAQGAATATKDIPIVFSAITDPIAANLLKDLDKPDGNITGVSDAIDVEKIFTLADELTPGIKKFGFLYNSAEANSVSVINNAKKFLGTKNIEFSEKTVTTSSEIQQAARTLFETCDAVFSPIDNTVAGSMAMVSAEAISAKKPMYVSADSMVADGGLATVGVNYTVLGQKTADMTLKVLKGTAIAEIPVEVITDTVPVVNTETAAAIGVDVSKYAN